MTLIKKQYALTFSEVFYKGSGDLVTVDFHNNSTFDTVCICLAHTSYYSEMDAATGTLAKKIWDKVCNEFSKQYIAISDKSIEELTRDECEKIAVNLLQEWLNLFYNTYDYYSTLIGFYESKKANLLDKVKSTTDTKVKFNDVPQTTAQGSFEGDSYATNYTHSEGSNETDFATLMTRLREIQDDFKNVWNDWIYEFRRLFLEDNWEV